MSSPDINDFHYETPPRIMGSETEYTVQAELQPKLHTVEALKPYIVYGNYYHWLSNGAKLYYDCSSSSNDTENGVLEYATPECESAQELVLYEKAGERIVHAAASEITSANEITYPVYKRTAYETLFDSENKILSNGRSTGHHENYFTPFEPSKSKYLNAFLGYLATRPVWAGAGMVTHRGYILSQKNDALDYSNPLNGRVTGDNGKLILIRKAKRLEVRSADGNMSPWAIRTKFAMTSLVLRMIEHDSFPEKLAGFSQSHIASMATATSCGPIESLGGRWTAADYQKYIAQKALDFAETKDIPKEEIVAAQDIIDICNQLTKASDIFDSAYELSDRVDWAAKLTLLKRRFNTSLTDLASLSASNLSYVQRDLLWEAVGEASISSRWYNIKGNATDLADLTHALTTPPATRAQERVRLLRQEGDKVSGIDWESLDIDNYSGGIRTIEIDSPYLSQD